MRTRESPAWACCCADARAYSAGVLAATGITSARLARELAAVRVAADARADTPEMRALVACIDDVTGAGEVSAGDAGQVGRVVVQTRSNESR